VEMGHTSIEERGHTSFADSFWVEECPQRIFILGTKECPEGMKRYTPY